MIDPAVIDLNSPESVIKAAESGVAFEISPTSSMAADESLALCVRGVSDRTMLYLSGIEFAGDSTPPSYPFSIEWSLGMGAACGSDRVLFLSGETPDTMLLTSRDDLRDRRGLLYHAANMLVGQWCLYARVVGATSKVKAKVYVLADHLGGGGEVAVFKGGLFY